MGAVEIMFGLEFLLPWMFAAIPLAGLPILLHLLFRRKSPVVPFSTLRFIKSSIQQTAARKKVQRWMLLACRVLLLLLLIIAIAQPFTKGIASLFGSQSIVAAIVVDTSYSMELQDHQTPLLLRANDSIDQLLRGPLQNARVAIFKSRPANPPERFETVGEIQTNWRELTPEPALTPLVDRVNSAMDQLKQQDADHRWLVVISDLQRREFSRPLPEFPDGKTVLLDLHPEQVHAAAITKVSPEPAQPRLGIAAQVAVEISGRANDSRAVSLSIVPAGNSIPNPNPTGNSDIAQPNLPMAKLDNSGRVSLRVPFTFASQSWLLLNASLQTGDDLPWANSRTQLVKIPSPAITAIAQMPHPNAQANRILGWALDPSEGNQPAWPISLRPPGPLHGDENIVAVNLTEWPDEPTVKQWIDIARRGGTLDIFVQPGLEESWAALPASQKTALQQLLPGPAISPAAQGPFLGSVARQDDVVLTDLAGAQSASGKLIVTRIVPFDISDPTVETILNAAPQNPTLGSKLHGLLMRRKIGAGQAFTWATLPTPLYGNLITFEYFVPILVNTAIHPQADSQSQNVEIGNRIALPAQEAPQGSPPLDLVPPQGPAYLVKVTNDPLLGKVYLSDPTTDPGLYTWKSSDRTIAYTNVQYPASEAVLEYRPAPEVATAGPDVLIVHSIADLQAQIQKVSEPDSHWTVLIALMLFLLCLEALMGNISKVWKPPGLRFFTPKIASE